MPVTRPPRRHATHLPPATPSARSTAAVARRTRELADAERIRQLMVAMAEAAREPGRVYFTGGATAVLVGWRQSTVDVDLALVPEADAVLRAIPELKEKLRVNVELASPADFIPVPA